MATRERAAGDTFSLADCAAAPSLFYADWTHAIDAKFANVIAYRQRLPARPSFARCVDEARPFRPYFPLGAPDRDKTLSRTTHGACRAPSACPRPSTTSRKRCTRGSHDTRRRTWCVREDVFAGNMVFVEVIPCGRGTL